MASHDLEAVMMAADEKHSNSKERSAVIKILIQCEILNI